MVFLTPEISMKQFLWLAFIMVLCISGCTTLPTGIPPSKTATGMDVQVTSVQNQPGTVSSVPTRTPKREPVLNATVTPASTAGQATAQGREAFDLCQSQFDEQRVSPKKGWYLCEHGDPQGADILLINADGRRWSLSYQDTYGIDYSGEIRYFQWTPDEAFLYFAVMEPWEMYGPFTANADALFRMDLSDGSVVKLLGTVDTFQPDHDFYIVSISPTGRRLAYSGGYNWLGTAPQTVLHILDFQSGQEFLIPMDLKYYQIGNLTWSEDGLKLAYKLYSTGEEICKYSYSVGLLDLQKKSAVTFIRDQPVDECGGNPGSYEILNVSDQAVLLEYQGEKWVYEIDTQKLHELN